MLEIVDKGDVRVVRLQRPPVNALDGGLISALLEAVEAAPKDGVKGLVLAGRPGMFSAGLDVPALLQLDRTDLEGVWREFYQLMRALSASPLPVAAAVTGHSPAGGAVLAIFCDHRVMAEGKFKIGLNEVRVGIALPSAIYRALERLVGPRQAERCAVRGELLDAAAAHQIGLVDELCPAEEVEGKAVAWVESLLELPPSALAATRELARRDLVEAVAQRAEGDVQAATARWFSEETQAALSALVASLAKK